MKAEIIKELRKKIADALLFNWGEARIQMDAVDQINLLAALDELERVRPLVEAVEADNGQPSMVEVQLRAHMNPEKLERILRAALALKEGEK